MDSFFDNRYYYRLYTANLKSIIGFCKCDKFDPLNTDVEFRLNEIYVFLDSLGNSWDFSMDEIEEIRSLFRKAVGDFDRRFVQETRLHPANMDEYKRLILSW